MGQVIAGIIEVNYMRGRVEAVRSSAEAVMLTAEGWEHRGSSQAGVSSDGGGFGRVLQSEKAIPTHDSSLASGFGNLC